MSYEQQLANIGIILPVPPTPVATYIPAVLAGELLFLSGVIPFREGTLAFQGKLGRELTLEQGTQAARLCLIKA